MGHEIAANDGNSQVVRIFIAVSSSNGPLEDLPKGSFELIPLAAPTRGGVSEKKARHDIGKGFYSLDIFPTEGGGNPNWVKGLYLFGIVVKSTVGWGTAVAEVLIDVNE